MTLYALFKVNNLLTRLKNALKHSPIFSYNIYLYKIAYEINATILFFKVSGYYKDKEMFKSPYPCVYTRVGALALYLMHGYLFFPAVLPCRFASVRIYLPPSSFSSRVTTFSFTSFLSRVLSRTYLFVSSSIV